MKCSLQWGTCVIHITRPRLVAASILFSSGMTALHASCEGGHEAFVKFLLERAGTDEAKLALCAVKDSDGKVPADLAIAVRCTCCARTHMDVRTTVETTPLA